MKNSKNPNKIVNYDKQSDVLYFGIRKGVEEEAVEIAPGVVAELNQKGKVIGIEVLNASKVLKPLLKPVQHPTLHATPR